MPNDISGFGLKITLIATTTFPTGITLTQFADDADSIDSPSITIGEAAMGLNGDLITWSKAVPLPVNLNVIPDGTDDQNLAILLENNRVGAGKISTRDTIILIVAYPNGATVTFTNGKILEGMTTSSVASAGRKKTKPYMFKFENRVVTGALS